MSKRNGDKARADKARMKKLRRRENNRALRKAPASNPAPLPEAKSR